MKSFFTHWYRATRPVPDPGAVVDPAKLALKSRQRRFLKRCAGIALFGAGGVYAYTYLADAPNRARAELARGVKLTAPGTYSEAIAHFDHAIGISPDLAEAYLYRAVAEHGARRPAEALADLEKAIDLDSKLVRAYNERGQIFLESGDDGKAIAEFTASLQVKPSLEGFYQRGQVYEKLGQHTKAIADFDAAISEFPSAPYTYRARATAKRNTGDREGAKADEQIADRIEGVTPR